MDTTAYAAVARRVTAIEVKYAETDTDYAALVAHFGLTAETDSKVLTSTARLIVLDGAPKSAKVTESDLTGKDPGADAKNRNYWKAARAVRAGLVRNIEKDETETEAALRVTLSGEGGGSTVVPTDHPLYAALVEMIAAKS